MPTGIYKHKKTQGFQKGHKINLGKIQTEECVGRRIEANTKHGCCKNRKMTKTYAAWVSMRQRCNNNNNPAYKNYGGRGIEVCERWNSFENFFADMGECPEDLMLDRIDNNGNYESLNCRWTDVKTSGRNNRWVKLSIEKTKLIRRLRSEGYLLCEIAEQFNISKGNVSYVINNIAWK